MDLPVHVKTSASRSTSGIINKIHGMAWLKQDSASPKKNMQLDSRDGKILSAKKTDEDYFVGTRDVKRGKKKKERAGKAVWRLDELDSLINLTSQKAVPELKEESNFKAKPPEDDKRIFKPLNIIENATPGTNTVWSKSNSIADKLFPNVQSVVIDRLEEEEMFSQALAESIATVQLERFKRSSLEKENRWDALYGDNDDDDDGWNGPKSNLPSDLDATSSTISTSQKKSCDDNNNSPKPGILRNKQAHQTSTCIPSEALDFEFKKKSDIPEAQVKTTRSSKSVVFNESIDVKVVSHELSEDDKNSEECSEKLERPLIDNGREPTIDRFGRVNGYSERRLFMGKGARLKEQQYIQSRRNMGDENGVHQKLQSRSQVPMKSQIVETQNTVRDENMRGPKKLEEHKNLSKTPEPNLRKQNDIVNDGHKIPKVLVFSSQAPRAKDTALKQSKSTRKLPRNNHFEKSKTLNQTSTVRTSNESCGRTQSSMKKELQAPIATEITEQSKLSMDKENISRDQEIHSIVSARTLPGESFSNYAESDILLTKMRTISPSNLHHEVNATSGSCLDDLVRNQSPNIQNSQRNMVNEDTMLNDSTILQTRVNTVPELELPGRGAELEVHCDTSTGTSQSGYASNVPEPSQLHRDLTATPINPEFQTAANHNLYLAEISSYADQNKDMENLSQHLNENYLYSQMKNNFIPGHQLSLNGVLLPSQNLNNLQHVQPAYMESDGQAYCNMPSTQLPAQYNHYPLLNCMQTSSEYAYFVQQLAAQHLPYVNDLPNHQWNVTEFAQGNENILLGTCTKDLQARMDCNKSPSYTTVETGEKRILSPQPLPGSIRCTRLPPGFTRNNVLNNSFSVSPPQKNDESEKGSIPFQQSGNCREQTQSPFNQNRSSHPQESATLNRPPQNNCSASLRQENYYKSQITDECHDSKITENRPMPYPILGASTSSDGKHDQINPSQYSKQLSDTYTNHSFDISQTNDEQMNTNNNYLPANTCTTISDCNQPGMNYLVQDNIPTIYEPATLYPSSSNNMTNWQYKMNTMNMIPVPMNIGPEYQPTSMCDPNHWARNFIPSMSVASPVFSAGCFPLLQSNKLHPMQMPMYSMPHVMDSKGSNTSSLRHDAASFEANYNTQQDPAIMVESGARGPMVGGDIFGNSHFHFTPDGKYVANVPGYANYYGARGVPKMQNACHLQNSQMNKPIRQIFDTVPVTRGRGRLTQRDLL